MRRLLGALGCLALLTGALALTTAQATARAGSIGAPASTLAGSPIEHVVVIYQENHTFDDVLGAVCLVRTNPCNGYTGPVTFTDGMKADNIVQPDLVPEVDHSPYSQNKALHHSWDAIQGCRLAPYRCISHADPANIPNLAALANTFTVSDATFAAGRSASFGAHVTLAAGTYDGFSGHNPVRSTTGMKAGPGWGCPSDLDALWGPAGNLTYQPSCIPNAAGFGPYRLSQVPYVPTIMQRLEAAGLSWHIFAGSSTTAPSRAPFAVCPYFQWCYGHRFDLAHNSSRADFLTAAAAGALPTLSLLLPVGDMSQHNGYSMAVGDNYIGEMVSAVQNSPEWASTVVFVTYDDCGCFYDHVTPPSKWLGLRDPMVIVSPYAKPQGTDSTIAVQPYSMLAFIQHTFALNSLSSQVNVAYDYANAFDFAQQPLPGPAMTTQRIPVREQARLARLLPHVREDPT